MRTIGLIGGMSWESTAVYYRVINQVVGERLGGLHSAKILLSSVDFFEVEELQNSGRWLEAGELLTREARALERCGAELLILCTNTMHKVADQIVDAVSLPFLHIADATSDEIVEAKLERVGLLGTRFTMEEAFYRGRLAERHGLEVLTPAERDRRVVDRVIYEELCLGLIEEASRSEYVRIVEELVARGCEGIVLGCTEIGLLLRAENSPVPLFDTARIHARRAALEALRG